MPRQARDPLGLPAGRGEFANHRLARTRLVSVLLADAPSTCIARRERLRTANGNRPHAQHWQAIEAVANSYRCRTTRQGTATDVGGRRQSPSPPLPLGHDADWLLPRPFRPAPPTSLGESLRSGGAQVVSLERVRAANQTSTHCAYGHKAVRRARCIPPSSHAQRAPLTQ